ncbi:MAG TPA: hydroxyisourate hydrolase [Candidatus Acidoferrum sp.]|nr:hydroxyisourate hydrolase [Candidatus Acidoferrum sp.]
MKRISTHVLDTVRGKPAAGVPVRLERENADGVWQQLGAAHTDQDGRCAQLLPEEDRLPPGHYRLSLATGAYFTQQGIAGLYPVVEITFEVRSGEEHFHIPLLLSPNGYTTYRGS